MRHEDLRVHFGQQPSISQTVASRRQNCRRKSFGISHGGRHGSRNHKRFHLLASGDVTNASFSPLDVRDAAIVSVLASDDGTNTSFSSFVVRDAAIAPGGGVVEIGDIEHTGGRLAC